MIVYFCCPFNRIYLQRLLKEVLQLKQERGRCHKIYLKPTTLTSQQTWMYQWLVSTCNAERNFYPSWATLLGYSRNKMHPPHTPLPPLPLYLLYLSKSHKIFCLYRKKMVIPICSVSFASQYADIFQNGDLNCFRIDKGCIHSLTLLL